ncbi:NAD(P)H-binding protein [Actinomadura hibisca]|uniref:NAD(P)H-binding protein n=1 Tax=Actinomadura hibisca TaxID=68565 RepID=UPI00082C31C1|nr:NAD(P)H-binding protein [Actinomadura hibisca]
MILVTGATGTVGRPLVDLLLAHGAKVRAVTRAPSAAALPDAVQVVEGDPALADDALDEVTALLLNPRALGRSADPQAVGTAAARLLDLARDRGATRVVTLSALNVDHDAAEQPSRLRGEYNKEVEAAAVASGLAWTALRSGYYAVNTITSWAAQIRAGDVVRGAHAGSTWAPLHERDLAAVAAHALLTDDLAGRRPVLTGPRSLTQPQMVAQIGAAIGRPLRFQEVPPEAAEQGMLRSGMPEALARGFLTLQARSYLQHDLVTGEVEQILGRPGLTFAQWADEHADAFRSR